MGDKNRFLLSSALYSVNSPRRLFSGNAALSLARLYFYFSVIRDFYCNQARTPSARLPPHSRRRFVRYSSRSRIRRWIFNSQRAETLSCIYTNERGRERRERQRGFRSLKWHRRDHCTIAALTFGGLKFFPLEIIAPTLSLSLPLLREWKSVDGRARRSAITFALPCVPGVSKNINDTWYSVWVGMQISQDKTFDTVLFYSEKRR